MEKITSEYQLLKVVKMDVQKMYEDARDDEIFNNGELWKEFSNRIYDIERNFLALGSDLHDVLEIEYKSRARIDSCKRRLENAEAEILKEVPYSAKLLGTFGDVVPEPFNSSEAKIGWFFDYVTYLFGLNNAFYLSNMSWLLECKKEIRELQSYLQRLQPMEELWTSVFRLKVCLDTFVKDFDAAKLDLSKRDAFLQIESV